MVKAEETLEPKGLEGEEKIALDRFMATHMKEMAQISILWGVLLVLGALVTAWLLKGSPTYADAGGFARAAVWVVWLAIFGATAAYKWRVMLSAVEADGYRWGEFYGASIRQYLPMGAPLALLAVAMAVALCRLDHAEYLLGLFLLSWGAAIIPMALRWESRPFVVLGAAMLGLGFLQVILWPSYVLTTVVLVGLLWLGGAAYFWSVSS